jgi:hypothetical protein
LIDFAPGRSTFGPPPAAAQAAACGLLLLRPLYPTTEEGQQRLKGASPLFFADNIKIPLMLVHGVRDGKVRCDEAERMVAALWKRGVPAEYLRLSDEGHAFSHPLNRSAVFAEVEQFFAEHLGGVFDGISEEEERRLGQIRMQPGSCLAGEARAV